MEKAMIIALLEKYWQAETTVEEEKALAAWFNTRDPRPDPDLEPYGALFGYFAEESRVSPGPDLESRILQAVADTGLSNPTALVTRPAPILQFHWGLVSAAATVLIAVASLFLFRPVKPATPPVAQATQIKDTYDNPEQALAAVRHALLIASAHLNEGRKQISNK